MDLQPQPWYRQLNRYHWFVLVVASLGWLFDTLDQQLFLLARAPAMNDLLPHAPGEPPDPSLVKKRSGLATSIFLIGWATGGLTFGMLGDRIGRAKTMLLTILLYSIFTGFSAFSIGFWDFTLWRFLTGLGVGGEFAVGVSLVAEVMPEKARPFALGLLQALSAVGNISAALISLGMGHLEGEGLIGHFALFGIRMTAWRLMFVVGTVPALLAIVIRRRLKEPERWQSVARGTHTERLGSYRELFGDVRWRRRAIVGMLLAASGVIALWGIGFYSFELTRAVLGKTFADEARRAGEAEHDRDYIRMALAEPTRLESAAGKIEAANLLSPTADHPNDARELFTALLSLRDQGQSITAETVISAVDENRRKNEQAPQSPTDIERLRQYLDGRPSEGETTAHVERIALRTTKTSGRLTRWAAYTGIVLNLGAFLGIYSFSLVTHRIGRRPAFAISFVLALLATAMTFWFLDEVTDVFWMYPIMGFCQLALFGGYAIYFPELFPTRLRSTGISFCYNVGRYVAAFGPSALGWLSGEVYKNYDEPLRYAGVTMCAVFIVGLLVLPFAPETKGKPLPE